MKERDILFERGCYWIKASDRFKGFEVYQTGLTHSTRVASIGYAGQPGLDRAKAEIERRLSTGR